LAQPAAVLRPEAPDAAAARLPAAHAVGAPRAAPDAAEALQQEEAVARGAVEEPQQEAAARDAVAVRRREVPDAAALPREVRDVRPEAPGAAAGLPLAAAVWVFLRVLPPAPSPTAWFARATERLRMASPKELSSQVARDEVLS
jgi:hypothetical protein